MPILPKPANSLLGTTAKKSGGSETKRGLRWFSGDSARRGSQEQIASLGGSQSFNAVNQMRVLGRWMRILTIPNQSSVAKAYEEFDEHGRMKPSSYYERVVDVMEELVKFTLLTHDIAPYLVARYSERKESHEALGIRMQQNKL
jgi:hypothetical protein